MRDDPMLLALVSSARHELRAPLQAIQGFADLLASESYGGLGAEQRVFVEHIMQGSAELSRALDACFELVQAEVLQLPSEPLAYSCKRLLEEALQIAESRSPVPIASHLEGLDDELTIEVDLHEFYKTIGAIVTAIAPLARGPLTVRAHSQGRQVEVTFVALPSDDLPLRALSALPRRNLSARAMLWLRLSSALLARASGELLTSDGYERVRIGLRASSGR